MILTLFLFSVQVHPSISYFYSNPVPWIISSLPKLTMIELILIRSAYTILGLLPQHATLLLIPTATVATAANCTPTTTVTTFCSCAIDYDSGGICHCISYWFQIHHMMIITMMITTEMIQLIPSNDANTVFHFKFCCCCSSIVQPTVNPNDDWVHILNLFLLIIITILLICFLFIPWSTFDDDDTTTIATTSYYYCYRSFQCLLRIKFMPSILQVYYFCSYFYINC